MPNWPFEGIYPSCMCLLCTLLYCLVVLHLALCYKYKITCSFNVFLRCFNCSFTLCIFIFKWCKINAHCWQILRNIRQIMSNKAPMSRWSSGYGKTYRTGSTHETHSKCLYKPFNKIEQNNKCNLMNRQLQENKHLYLIYNHQQSPLNGFPKSNMTETNLWK